MILAKKSLKKSKKILSLHLPLIYSYIFKKNDGPAWPWWVLAVIPAEDKIKMHVLAQTSLLKRLTLMSRVIACIINNQGH